MADTNHRPETPRGLRRQLGAHGAATMQELREFLGQMKGKRPKEVLGLIAQSSLMQGMFWSTALVAGLTIALTFTMWGVKKAQGDFEPVAAKSTELPAPAADSSNAAPADPNAAAASTPAANNAATNPPTAPGQPNPLATPMNPPGGQTTKPPADPLGIGEAKLADPKVNPLENRGDDILNELNKR